MIAVGGSLDNQTFTATFTADDSDEDPSISIAADAFKDRAGNDNADVTPATGTKDSSRPTMEITLMIPSLNFWFYHRRCDCSRRITEQPSNYRYHHLYDDGSRPMRSKIARATTTPTTPQARKIQDQRWRLPSPMILSAWVLKQARSFLVLPSTISGGSLATFKLPITRLSQQPFDDSDEDPSISIVFATGGDHRGLGPTNNRHIRSKRGHFWFYHRRCDCSRRMRPSNYR